MKKTLKYVVNIVENQRESLLPLPIYRTSRDRCIVRDDIGSNAVLTHLVEQGQSFLPLLSSFRTSRDRCIVRY